MFKKGHIPWNKNLKKGEHPSIEKIGFQKGHTINIKPKIERICFVCQKRFYVNPCRIKAKYCSQKCFGIFEKEENNPFYNKTHSKVWKERMSKIRLGKFMGKYSPCWKGGKFRTKKGYILIKKYNHPFHNNNNYVFEHRLVVEKQIGRYLFPTEVTHHLNRIKDDNRPQNLMAFVNDFIHRRFEKNPNNVNPKEIIFDGRKIKRNLFFLRS